MRNKDVALEVHAREELGVDPDALGAPYSAAASSFVAFAVGGVIPLVPWFLTDGNQAVIASMAQASVTALGIGCAIGVTTGRGIIFSALRQLGVAVIAGAATYVSGAILGVEVT